MIHSYKDLMVWQKAMDLVVEVYRIVQLLPKEETYGLSDQMRRAAVSIPSNIAEGKMRNTRREYINFLYMARGSNAELQTQCYICARIHYVTEKELIKTLSLSNEVGRMINALILSLTTTIQLFRYASIKREEIETKERSTRNGALNVRK